MQEIRRIADRMAQRHPSQLKSSHGRSGKGRVKDCGDRLAGDKLFGVFSFMPREGRYIFCFDAGQGRFGAWADWTRGEGVLRLQTSMAGPAGLLAATRHAV
ncbi:hypothetical protein IT41_07795 [Paracoccus halophilus]|uniref:Uncharacterized protein n=2 Tax=Paracoccus halophilus TaxID=376733 RepID=A0A099F3E9_9RHOB|nr:hypothetical protein [Paracoccus halophilus]KGJ04924.1 hypothetical protein IT41_07795 [Paracoccus halophilus]